MRFSIATFAVLAAAVSASASIFARQDPKFPACASMCFRRLADSSGCEPSNDDACLCKNADFLEANRACVTESCQGADLITAEAADQDACAAVAYGPGVAVPSG